MKLGRVCTGCRKSCKFTQIKYVFFVSFFPFFFSFHTCTEPRFRQTYNVVQCRLIQAYNVVQCRLIQAYNVTTMHINIGLQCSTMQFDIGIQCSTMQVNIGLQCSTMQLAHQECGQPLSAINNEQQLDQIENKSPKFFLRLSPFINRRSQCHKAGIHLVAKQIQTFSKPRLRLLIRLRLALPDGYFDNCASFACGAHGFRQDNGA